MENGTPKFKLLFILKCYNILLIYKYCLYNNKYNLNDIYTYNMHILILLINRQLHIKFIIYVIKLDYTLIIKNKTITINHGYK